MIRCFYSAVDPSYRFILRVANLLPPLILFVSTSLAQEQNPEEVYRTNVAPLLKTYCSECHGESDPDAGLTIEALSKQLYRGKDATQWQEVVDRLNLGEMPPPDEAQPEEGEREAIIDWIQDGLREVQTLNLRSGGTPVLRRLNRYEYANTISDLLHLPNYDPGPRFPEDAKAFGFDNNASALTMSPLLMERYLEIAAEAVDRAIHIGERPESTTQRFDVVEYAKKRMRNKYYIETVVNGRWWVVHDKHLAVRGRGVRTDVGDGFKVPQDGEYIFRMQIAGTRGKEQVIPEVLVRLTNAKQARDVATIAVDNTDIAERDVRVYLRQGRVDFRLNFANGNKLEKTRQNFDQLPIPGEDDYEGEPRSLQFESVQLIGPITEQWPPKSYESVFQSGDDTATVETVLTRFCKRAFRRPVEATDVKPFLTIYRGALKEQATHEEAIGYALKAILCSPQFLFLAEGSNGSGDRVEISDYELAARLSYFLWSSMPDEELFQLAERHQLSDAKTLDEQVDRMLGDPKSEAFVENFVGQWLQLRELGAMRPSVRLHRDYFDQRIEEHSRQETLRFFREILDGNESILNFIDSDFTMLNGTLAKWYGIQGVTGPEFRRVALPADSPRGGVLTQASVLTLTSDGTRTKPVTRGAWVLTNIVGSPPPPPPPNAGDLPVIPNKPLTVRQRLDHHRQIPACASCHRKIDPMGFALDNFDMLGRFRADEMSENGNQRIGRINASGRLPDGREFKSLGEFKRLLLDDKQRFTRCLTEKLMTYALGRGLEFSDRPHVDGVLKQHARDEFRFKSLIKHIVKSKPFHTR